MVAYPYSYTMIMYILNRQSSKSDRVMCTLRPLMPLKNIIQFKAENIPRKSNIIPGAIPPKQWEAFRKETFLQI